MFYTFVNAWLNEKTAGFAYLPKNSVCCNITHYHSLWKTPVYPQGRMGVKKVNDKFIYYKNSFALQNHWKVLRDLPGDLDYISRTSDFGDHFVSLHETLVRPMWGHAWQCKFATKWAAFLIILGRIKQERVQLN